MGCLSGCLMSSASIQKLFCGICLVFECSFDEFVGGKSGLPILFLHHLRTALLKSLLMNVKEESEKVGLKFNM